MCRHGGSRLVAAALTFRLGLSILLGMTPPFYLAIEGPIGVGKTTLARIIQQEMGGALLLEVFEENPFLSDFYADRERYAFQTQMFFLLSRYRQQHQVVSRLLDSGSLVSDYLFAKDRLFAHLNLEGDELIVYEHVHAALGERIPAPGLIVYLRASTDALMNRIAIRDRPYERAMSREYISKLRVAYDRFFADFDQAPVLVVDTDDVDIVSQLDDRNYLVNLVRSAMAQGPFQQSLPQLEPALAGGGVAMAGTALLQRDDIRPDASSARLRPTSPRLADLQRFHQMANEETGVMTDLYLNYISLTEEVGRLGSELKRLWLADYHARGLRSLSSAIPLEKSDPAANEPGPSLAPAETADSGFTDVEPGAGPTALQGKLASILIQVLELANQAGVNLEEAYLGAVGPKPSAGNWRQNRET